MIRSSFAVFLTLCLWVSSSLAQSPNSPGDDYAASFRQRADGTMELWFTSTESPSAGRSRAMMVSACGPNGFETPVHVSDRLINFTDDSRMAGGGVTLNGVPTFTCSGDRGAFVSNRLTNGSDQGNDIYEMHLRADGAWDVRRITEINSPNWDDTPFLSEDGQVLYFSSDRESPGTKRTDIYYSRRTENGWSEPEPVSVVNTTSGSEESPCFGPDGYFYYASNRSGRYKIYRSRMGTDGVPSESGSLVTWPGINSDTTDATHPMFSPGGQWFVYTSNKPVEGSHDDNIHWFRVDQQPLTMNISVQKRFKVRSRNSDFAYDSTAPISTSIQLTGNFVGSPLKVRSDRHGLATLQLPVPSDPASDLYRRKALLKADETDPRFISAIDTLLFVTSWDKPINHSLFVWDTSSISDPTCKQTFPIAEVQFFIEGYWGPTTSKYRNHVPACPSFFTDPSCLVTEQVCESNNLYTYKYTAARIDAYSNCFNYREFRSHGAEYAEEVDGALDNLVVSMQSALQMDCIQRAARRNEKITVTVTGYTDPKPYRDPDCSYNGETVDFAASPVRLAHTERERYFTKNTRMNILGVGGNQLLSDLRAYYAAVLLDTLWKEAIPQYQELRERGLVTVLSDGQAISKQTNREYASQRSISVTIDAQSEGIRTPGMIMQPGRIVEFWQFCPQSRKSFTFLDE